MYYWVRSLFKMKIQSSIDTNEISSNLNASVKQYLLFVISLTIQLFIKTQWKSLIQILVYRSYVGQLIQINSHLLLWYNGDSKLIILRYSDGQKWSKIIKILIVFWIKVLIFNKFRPNFFTLLTGSRKTFDETFIGEKLVHSELEHEQVAC